ncbi:MAG: DUF4384 domain-containing protein [bacterium]
MKHQKYLWLPVLLLLLGGAAVAQQDPDRDYPDEVYVDRIKVDRYLDAEIWVDHLDGDYYVGETVDLSYRVNRDAFVAIYAIDSRGRVDLLFPTYAGEDNFVYGGVTYDFPSEEHDFDLVVSGPEGVENIQIVASRERFTIPDWFDVSGLVCDWDDRFDFMDYVNAHYFVRYDGQRFAFDRTAMYVNEWEPTYFQPVYRPYYPSWTVCGNVYIDYPWGASIYIDGVYWGCTPLYIPRVYVGWHTFTVYDRHHHCWESDLHVTRYHTVVLDHQVVKPAPQVMSKYKEVRSVGFRDPVSNGYPNFKERQLMATTSSETSIGKRHSTVGTGPASKIETVAVSKKYVRGSSDLIKTGRGYETAGVVTGVSKRGSESSGGASVNSRERLTSRKKSSSGSDDSGAKRITTGTSRSGSGGSTGKRIQSTEGTRPNSTSTTKSTGQYKKKSGSATPSKGDSGGKAKQGSVIKTTKVESKGSAGAVKTTQPKQGNSDAGSKAKSDGSSGGKKSGGKTKGK